MSLEEAIAAHIAKMDESHRPLRLGESHCAYEEKRRITRKGNTAVVIVEEGECEWGGPIEDPFFVPYSSTYEAIFSPTGELVSTRYLGW